MLKAIHQSFKHTLIVIILIIVFIVSFLSIYSAFDRGHIIELLSHFRFQYLFVQLLSLTVLLFLKSRTAAFITVLLILPNLFQFVPYYLPKQHPQIKAQNTFKLLQLNVYALNREFEEVDQVIEEENPDVIALQEIRPIWAKHLQTRWQSIYPHQIIEPESTAFGIALLSKYPFESSSIRFYGKPFGSQKRFFPSIETVILLKDKKVQITNTHPLPPLKGYEVRNSQLQDIAKAQANKLPRVVVGDLNITPWSPYFTDFIQKSGLRDSQMGFGVQGSWSKLPFPFMQLSIDHVLVSDDFVVLDRRVGPDVGSDHLPVIVELGLKK